MSGTLIMLIFYTCILTSDPSILLLIVEITTDEQPRRLNDFRG